MSKKVKGLKLFLNKIDREGKNMDIERKVKIKNESTMGKNENNHQKQQSRKPFHLTIGK